MGTARWAGLIRYTALSTTDPSGFAKTRRRTRSSAALFKWCGILERVKGIEPSSFGWEPKALPLSYTRSRDSNSRWQREVQDAAKQYHHRATAFISCALAECGPALAGRGLRAMGWSRIPAPLNSLMARNAGSVIGHRDDRERASKTLAKCPPFASLHAKARPNLGRLGLKRACRPRVWRGG